MKNFNLFFKKSFISFLCLVIFLTSFPVGVFATSVAPTDNITILSTPTKATEITPSSGGTDTIKPATAVSPTISLPQKNSNSINNAVNGVYKVGATESFKYNPAATTNSTSKTSAGSIDSKPLDKILPTQESGSGSESNAASDALSCSVGQILANGISGIATKAIDTIFGALTNTEVPVDDPQQKHKAVGMLVVWGVPILPSWDAIAYCLANAIIAYVADSTIAWIQSGFKGNPAFVDDPTALFQDLADYQMNSFVSTLEDGLLCDSFSSNVSSSLIDDYTSDYQTDGKCALGSLEDGVSDMITGAANSFAYEGWFAASQNENNNFAGAYLKGKTEYERQVAARQNSTKTELDWNNGYYSWKQKDGTSQGKTVTPGNAVISQLESRMNLAPDRLVLADKFDQVISALVNYLIKTALTETLGAVKSATN